MNQITEADIRDHASERSYERGYNYYRANAVEDMAQRGNLVTAAVEGSAYEPYQVQVVLSDNGIQSAFCDCPYDWGGYCKHIVAVLLTLIHEGESVEIKPELTTLLADLSEAQLRQLILNIAAEETAVANAIEREVSWFKETPSVATTSPTTIAVDLTAIRREMGKSFRLASSTGGGGYGRYDYFDYDEGLEIHSGEIFDDHLQKVDDLLQAGDVATAVAVITAIIEEWIEGVTELDEWVYEYNEDPLYEDAQQLGAVLAEVLLSLNLSPDEKDEWKKRINYWEGQIGDMGMAETAVVQGWDYPPLVATLQGEVSAQGAWEGEPPYFADKLCLVRLTILQRQGRNEEYIHLAKAEGQDGRYVNMLATTGQYEKAVTEARENLSIPADVFSLARILIEEGQTAKALEIGEYGLGLTLPNPHSSLPLMRDQSKVDLAQWLSRQAEDAGNPSLALKAAKTAFSSGHNLADYQTAQRLAGKVWPAVKEELLQNLLADG